jgi:hypothetical protein
MKKLCAALALASLGAVVFACTGGGSETNRTSGPVTATPTSQEQVEVPPGITVTATFVSATLGDDCAAKAESSFAPSDCYVPPDGGTCRGTSTCQQSNMQIAFKSAGNASAKIEIVSVSLRDASGTEVAKLTSREPRIWKDNAYVAWDEVLPAASELKASYNLSAPPWSTMSGTVRTTEQTYRLRVEINVNGSPVTIESTDLTREPVVVT